MAYSEKYLSVTDAIRSKGKEILPAGAKVILYGSRARGDFKEDSDWDILILLPGENTLSWEETDRYAFPLEMIGWNLGETISAAIYSYGDWERRRFLPYYQNVEKDKIILLFK